MKTPTTLKKKQVQYSGQEIPEEKPGDGSVETIERANSGDKLIMEDMSNSPMNATLFVRAGPGSTKNKNSNDDSSPLRKDNALRKEHSNMLRKRD